jgi:hypothetical protein
MALMSCSECGGKVSDKAASCPHCGAPVEKAPPEIEPTVSAQSAAEESRGYVEVKQSEQNSDILDPAIDWGAYRPEESDPLEVSSEAPSGFEADDDSRVESSKGGVGITRWLAIGAVLGFFVLLARLVNPSPESVAQPELAADTTPVAESSGKSVISPQAGSMWADSVEKVADPISTVRKLTDSQLDLISADTALSSVPPKPAWLKAASDESYRRLRATRLKRITSLAEQECGTSGSTRAGRIAKNWLYKDSTFADTLALMACRKLAIGMTSSMVYDALGRPTTVNSEVLSSGEQEQWVYEGGLYVYLEKDPLLIFRVTAFQSSR